MPTLTRDITRADYLVLYSETYDPAFLAIAHDLALSEADVAYAQHVSDVVGAAFAFVAEMR